MTLSATSDSPLCPQFQRRNEQLGALRHVLVAFGAARGAWQEVSCGCGGAECPPARCGPTGGTETVGELLHTLHTRWDPDAPAGPHPPRPAELRSALLSFAQGFGLLQCRCVRHPCRHGDAPTMPLDELLELVDLEWHERSGCYHHLATEGEVLHVRRQQRLNLRLIHHLGRRLHPTDGVLQLHRSCRETCLYGEARHLALHCLNAWMPNVAADPVTRAFVRVVRALSTRAGWPAARAEQFLCASVDAFVALLVHGIADPLITETLYEPLQPTVPLNELLAHVNG